MCVDCLTEPESRAAIQRVVDRQEVLRLSILPGKERPLQMIRKSYGINFDFPRNSGGARDLKRLNNTQARFSARHSTSCKGPSTAR
jgi:hypothetical protein